MINLCKLTFSLEGLNISFYNLATSIFLMKNLNTNHKPISTLWTKTSFETWSLHGDTIIIITLNQRRRHLRQITGGATRTTTLNFATLTKILAVLATESCLLLLLGCIRLWICLRRKAVCVNERLELQDPTGYWFERNLRQFLSNHNWQHPYNVTIYLEITWNNQRNANYGPTPYTPRRAIHGRA